MAAKFRILMFPWLGHAHVFPYLELAKKLSNKNFHIYFCSTSINLNSIKNILQNDSSSHNFSIQLVELHLPPMPELPPQYHTTKNTPPHLLPLLIKAFQMSSSTFSDLIADLNPHLLIHDGFQPWSAKIASSKSIPSVFFSVSGSTSLSFFHHLYTHGSCESFPSNVIRLENHEMKSLFDQGESIEIKDKGEGFLYGVFDLSCEIVLIKSCRVLEGKYLDHLSTLCGKATISTGPLIMLMCENSQENDEIMNWLDKKRECSTLYISFGSENYLSKEQNVEIAKGLEFSNVDFIWVLRSPSGSDVVVEESLPEGFLEKVKHRGIVLQKWAPQTAILAHGNVGGYLSHCGWSSIIESIYFRVPVVALPLQSDHPVNPRMVVEAGVGVEVMRDDNGGFDGEGVAKAIKEVFVEESGQGLRRKAREMSEKMKMEEEEAIDEVAKELLRICKKK